MNDGITKREQEILELIADGNTDIQIATLFCISLNTANTHRKKLISKLGAKNVAHLIRIAIRKGLIK